MILSKMSNEELLENLIESVVLLTTSLIMQENIDKENAANTVEETKKEVLNRMRKFG